MSHHKENYVNPSHTKKLFANMKRAGKDFSGRITPLFNTMMQEQKSKRKQRKEAEVAHDETEHEESVPTPSNDPLPSGEGSMQLNDLMLEKRRKFITTGLKRLNKVGAARRIESSNDSLGAQDDASKQGMRIKDIDADAEVTLVNETQERQDEDLMLNTGVLDGDEMFVDATTGEKDEQSTKIDDSTAGEAVTTAGVEDSAAGEAVTTVVVEDSSVPTIPTTVKETLAQALMEIKAAKPKAKGIVFHDLEKQKDQVAFDEDLARNIKAQLDTEIIEEERLERQKQEEANIALIESWENTQAMIKTDRLLAERL
ncbi:hypothetical protein Tco_1426795 [Tanacetum coccineum]